MSEVHEQFAEKLVRDNQVTEFLQLLKKKGADLEIIDTTTEDLETSLSHYDPSTVEPNDNFILGTD